MLYVNEYYEMQWFHRLIAEKCQSVIDGGIKRLMILMPPQHGKSEITSRKLPAWALGKYPRTKIVLASYSAHLAQSFGREVRRTIESKEFTDVFGSLTGGGYINTQGMLETSSGGFLKTIGVGGSLTGTPADIAIIDDPVKDAMEAYSENSREKLWEWYLNVFLTRLHNNSRVILIMTRWHDDDLGGRILKKDKDKWEVVTIPAICENEIDGDIRKVGEPLWPNKHNLEKLLNIKSLSERTFAALYQQRPIIQGGNIIKSDWFKKVRYEDYVSIKGNAVIHWFVDTAYTKNYQNDPTGIIGACKIGNDLYIVGARKLFLEFPELIKYLPTYVKSQGYTQGSTIRIEPKANGLSVIQQMRAETQLNIASIPSPAESKETRLIVASTTVESGRVVIVEGQWNDEFITEVCSFPAAPHDEYPDLLGYAINYFYGRNSNLSQIAQYIA